MAIPYTHTEKLDHTCIRLIRLHHGSPEEPLRCSFEVHSLQVFHDRDWDADRSFSDLMRRYRADRQSAWSEGMMGSQPRYNAISYAWGTGTADETIECDGKVIKISLSLKQALIRFRSSTADRLLWADQLCVNQACNDERSAQVNIMKEIFTFAEGVMVWLGPDENDMSQHLRKTIDNATRHADFYRDPPRNLSFPTDDELVADGFGKSGSEEWKAVCHFQDLPFFERMWVVQEVVLARKVTVVWGELEIDWEDLLHALRFLSQYVGVIASDVRILIRIGHLMVIKRKSSLSTLLDMTRNLYATEEKDKIYAILGLMADPRRGARPLRADYAKSMGQIRQEATRYIIEEDAELATLSEVQHETLDASMDVPSWAITVRTFNDENLSTKPFRMFSSFKAHGDTAPHIEAAEDDRTLKVEGMVLEKAATCRERFLWGPKDWIKHLVSVWRAVEHQIDEDVEGRTMLDFVMAVAAGQVLDYTGTGAPATADVLLDFLKVAITPPLTAKMDEATEDPDGHLQSCITLSILVTAAHRRASASPVELRTFLPETVEWLRMKMDVYANQWNLDLEEVIDAMTYGLSAEHRHQRVQMGFEGIFIQTAFTRTLFQTETGHFALGPPAIRPGDLVCFLYGGPTPYVLRPLPTQGDYLFVGECYVSRWMDGQALTSGIAPEWFCLR